MPHAPVNITKRRLTATALLIMAAGLSACGDGGDDGAAPAADTPPAQTTSEAPAAVELDKVVDTPATAKAASATKVPADELKAQIAAIERGLKGAGFAPSNLGEVGEAKADIAVDTSWVVYVYDSERSTAEFALTMQDVYPDPANYEMFRVGNRLYLASMASALTADDKAKLDKIAKAAEGAIAAG